MKDSDRAALEAHLEALEAALNDIRTAVDTLNSILPIVCKVRRPDPAEAGRQVKPAALTTFDVYYADGATLRFVCHIEAETKEAAERLVRKRVPAEHRENMVVMIHRPIALIPRSDAESATPGQMSRGSWSAEILPMVRKARRPDSTEAGQQVKPAALITFDIYYADGATLRFVCHLEAETKEAAERLVRKRVPAEHRENMVVMVYRTFALIPDAERAADAYQLGGMACEAGIAFKAVPPEMQDLGQEKFAEAWQAGWKAHHKLLGRERWRSLLSQHVA